MALAPMTDQARSENATRIKMMALPSGVALRQMAIISGSEFAAAAAKKIGTFIKDRANASPAQFAASVYKPAGARSKRFQPISRVQLERRQGKERKYSRKVRENLRNFRSGRKSAGCAAEWPRCGSLVGWDMWMRLLGFEPDGF